jgi:putative ABC transport system permease protein
MSGRRLFHLRLWGPRVREGVDWELAHHLEERVDELVASGLTPAAARGEALRAFGDVATVRRQLLELDTRAARRRGLVRYFDDLVQDIRFGLRSIRLRPGLAAGIVLTLALGIGANAALFAVLDALLLRPLPYAAPTELADVCVATPQHECAGRLLPEPVARGWQASHPGAALLHARMTARYTGGIEARSVAVQAVTSDFHEVLGVAPVLGRSLLPEDEESASPHVALVDYGFWRGVLGGEASAIGGTIVLNGISHTVVGVMPARFRFPTYSTTEAWIPLRRDETLLGFPLRGGFIEAVARVDGARFDAANARIAAAGSALFRESNPESESSLRLRPMAEFRRIEEHTRAMMLLGGAALMILLVAGVNMVNLLLARCAARAEEIAVRMAVGAARGRIVRQVATEALLLALLGGAAAVGVAVGVVHVLRDMIPSSITFFAPYDIAVEQRTLLFTFAVAAASGLVFGLLPALNASTWATPAQGGRLSRYAGRTRGSRRLQRGLVVTEVAFSVTLLITAALLINSFTRLMRNDPGIRLDGLAVMEFGVSSRSYPEPEQRGAYLRRLEERVSALPGVESATISGGLPPRSGQIYFGVVFEPEGAPPVPAAEGTIFPVTDAAPNFFEVTGARLLAGRTFTLSDARDSGHVIIDENLARHLWAGESAVGRRFRIREDAPWLTVIGVMADLRLLGPDERRGEFAMLRPFANYDGVGGQLTMAVRTRGNVRAALPAIRAAVREVDPEQPIIDLLPARSYYARGADMPRFLALITGCLALLALVLAAIGIHGVLAFGVAQRRHEIGVRMVLGARADAIAGSVVAEGLALTAIGLALGVAGALLAARIVESALYGIGAVDVPTYLATAAVVLLVTLAATLRPALRATATDPITVIRGA